MENYDHPSNCHEAQDMLKSPELFSLAEADITHPPRQKVVTQRHSKRVVNYC